MIAHFYVKPKPEYPEVLVVGLYSLACSLATSAFWELKLAKSATILRAQPSDNEQWKVSIEYKRNRRGEKHFFIP